MNAIFKPTKVIFSLVLLMIVSLWVPQPKMKAAEAFGTDLFIRSVFHSGTSNNMIELFNGTGSTINLTGYYIYTYHNGQTSPTGTFSLPNVNLPHNNAYLIYSSINATGVTQAHKDYVNAFPLKVGSTDNNGFQSAQGGNDTYILRKGATSGTSVNLDIFGMLGYSPGSGIGWTELDGTTVTGIQYGFIETKVPALKPTNFQQTLVRRPDVKNPQLSALTYKGTTRNPSFQPSEWGVYSNGTFPANVYVFGFQAAIDQVINMIQALSNPITVADATNVASARTAYDALTSDQQTLVTNYQTLLDAEAVLLGLAEVTRVFQLIEALPDPVTLDDAADVEAARVAYDGLSTEHQALVTNRDLLFAAESRLVDLAAANTIELMIAGLPNPITLDDQAAIETVRTAFDELTLTQQGLVGNLALLQAAEVTLARLLNIDNVERLIQALPNPITLNDGVALAAARAAFNALTEDEKADVSNINTLIELENDYLDLTAAHEVITRIAALSNPITLADESAVAAALSAFQTLTPTQQGLVSNIEILNAAEQTLIALLNAIDQVIFAIDGLGDPTTLADETSLGLIREAYDALSASQQARVTNKDTFFEAESTLQRLLEEIDDVIALIAALPVPVTLVNETAVAEARAAFDALTVEQQDRVTNRIVLEQAEAVILDLNTPRHVITYVVYTTITTEIVKEGTGLQRIPTSPTRLGYTFLGWTKTGESTSVNLATFIVMRPERFVAQFELDPQSNESEYVVEVEGLETIEVPTEFGNENVSLSLNVDLVMVEEVPVNDVDAIEIALDDHALYTIDSMFVFDLSITVTFDRNGEIVQENISTLEEPLAITLNIPEDYRGFASYQIVRVHETEADLLATTYTPSTNTLAFTTDRFSTYGILFSNALVDNLMSGIDALPVPVTLADLSAVQALRADFNALTSEQQAMVTNIGILNQAEAILQTLLDDIEAVKVAIAGLPTPIQLSDESSLQTVRGLFDALTAEQQALVTNFATLVQAEASLQQLKDDITSVNEAIALLDDPVSLLDEEDVLAIREAYDALTEEQQSYIVGYDAFLIQEATVQAYRIDVDAVIAMIEALPSPMTIAAFSAMEEARSAYDALSSIHQGFVTNRLALVDRESAYATLIQEIADVNAAIAALPNSISLADQDAIASIREAYEALTDEQQTYVDDLLTLEQAEETIDDLLSQVSDVEARIDDLGIVTLDDRTSIETLRADYENLSEEQQALVGNLAELEAAEATLIALEAVETTILELPEAEDVTLEDEASIVAARAAYEALTEDQQQGVNPTVYQHLLDAEAALRDLNNANNLTLWTLLPLHVGLGTVILALWFFKRKQKEVN